MLVARRDSEQVRTYLLSEQIRARVNVSIVLANVNAVFNLPYLRYNFAKLQF